ncbi:MAG: ABC transporter ATP-binding protein [Verrucomicrobiia bacterium]|tara:strand:+ start:6602 stop:7333 length:732 start_codon:yes stop_codon:yes gene_type:complete
MTSPIPPAPDSSLVVARELSKTYGSGNAAVHALRGVNLDLPKGELVVLLGASGSGKSTLLNLIGGLDNPTGGSLHYRGWNVAQADEAGLTAYRRDVVGFVFQFYNLIASLTARENIGLITEVSRDPMSTDDALALVDLTNRANHFPAQLSGGEQQRVAIARAIAKRPELLLCDEPTGALDVKTGVLVLEAIQRINREIGTLTVVITHNAILAEMADRVFTMSDGRLELAKVNANPRPVGELAW